MQRGGAGHTADARTWQDRVDGMRFHHTTQNGTKFGISYLIFLDQG